jgi:hypothetical protein
MRLGAKQPGRRRPPLIDNFLFFLGQGAVPHEHPIATVLTNPPVLLPR